MIKIHVIRIHVMATHSRDGADVYYTCDGGKLGYIAYWGLAPIK